MLSDLHTVEVRASMRFKLRATAWGATLPVMSLLRKQYRRISQLMNRKAAGKHRLVVAALAAAFLLVPGRIAAQQTNSFESLKASHEMSMLEVGDTCVQREKEALKQYGKALDAQMSALKQKGELDAYLAVETERKRFSAEGTVQDAKESVPALADAIQAYHKTIVDVEGDKNRDAAALLKKYVAALDGIIKKLVQADKIAEAQRIKAEQDNAASELSNLESKQPPEPKTNEVEHKSPGKKEAGSGQEGGVKTYSVLLWMTRSSRWSDLNIPPVKKGDKIGLHCEARPLVASKGKESHDEFKIRIGESGKEFSFDSSGKYSVAKMGRVGMRWTTYYEQEPSLDFTAENEGRIAVYRNGLANFKLIVTVQSAEAAER